MISDSNNIWHVTVIIGSTFCDPPPFFNKKAYFFSTITVITAAQEWQSKLYFNQHILFTEQKSMQVDCFITPQINEKNWHTQNMDFLETQPKQMIDKVWLMFWSLINSPGICSHTEYYPSPTRCLSCIVKQLIAQT